MHLVDAGSISTRLFCSFSVSVCKRLNFYVWFYQFFYQFSPIIIINNTFNNIFRFFFSVLLYAIEVLLFPLTGLLFFLVIYAFVSAFSGHHIMVCINLVPCFFPVWNWKQKFIVVLSKMADSTGTVQSTCTTEAISTTHLQ